MFDLAKEVTDRFLRYVAMDTQSKEGVEDRYPSTETQLEFGRLLASELKTLGLEDVQIDKNGYVTATLPANLPTGIHAGSALPVVGLLAHMDTYHEVSGKDVKPMLHKNYDGGPITLPKLPNEPIAPKDNPELSRYVGDTIITSDGSTLLGADDKAGIAEIMTFLAWLQSDRSRPHPKLRIGFTPDEEVGNGTKFFDVKAFGADLAYTLDGSGMAEVEDETFCADTAFVKLIGKDVHPGYAKDKMVNAVRLGAEFIGALPAQHTPERTEGRQDYVHAYQCTGNVSECQLVVLLRSFTEDGLDTMHDLLLQAKQSVLERNPSASIEIQRKASYRNMKQVLAEHPEVVEYAEAAMKRCGLNPERKAIRGGTDGARLSFLSLPTPNLSAGGYNFHSRQEWIPQSGMVKAVEVLAALMEIWVEKGKPNQHP